MNHDSSNTSSESLAWFRRAPELAKFTMRHLVNRTEVWVQYLPLAARQDGRKAWTAPLRGRRGIDLLTLETVVNHFGSYAEHQLVAVHAISPANQCKWFAVDIDLHGATNPAKAARNLACAHFLHRRCRNLGLDVLVIDSNGRGGLHLWGILEAPAPSREVFDFVSWLVRDIDLSFGVKGTKASEPMVEVFPHVPALSPGGFGRALRLPGRHHTDVTHFSRVQDPGAETWLAGDAAIDRILGVGLIPTSRFRSVLDSHVERSKRIGTVRQPQFLQPRRQFSTPATTEEKRVRAEAYLAKLPTGLTDVRNRTAFGFAAFLAGDLGMCFEEVMVWLARWDDLNPTRLQDKRGYSEERAMNKLEEIAKSAVRNNINAKS